MKLAETNPTCTDIMHRYCVSMPDDDTAREVHLNSAMLRVLAHPLRSRILAALRVDGPATSTGVAHRLGTNTGATSYHLRELAKVGLVAEDKDRGTGRERWWRSSHESTYFSETEFQDDPDDRAAIDWLLGHYIRTKTRWMEDWLESRQEWPHEWRKAAASSDFNLRLTPHQVAAMYDDLHQVIERYRTTEGESDADVERVIVLLDVFPSPEPRI